MKGLRKVKKIISRWVARDLAGFCVRSGFLASCYYLFFDAAFRREQRAVLAGKLKHLQDTEKRKANYFLLVRNTHRIEKGLLMKPRKAVFGKDYIKETIDSFEGVWDAAAIAGNPQMKWFYDVLTAYFESVEQDVQLQEMERRFRQKTVNFHSPMMNKVENEHSVMTIAESGCLAVDEKGQLNAEKSVPYYRSQREKSTISYTDFFTLVRQRRSVRWFLKTAVPRAVIDQAILAANQSPSACNRQPFEYRIFDRPELVSKVAAFPMGTSGYGSNIPVFVVLVGNLDAYAEERDRHVIYIDAALAAMAFMLAAETLGLGTCAINWPDMENREQQMATFLNLSSYQRPLLCMGLGYPDPEGKVAFSAKRPITQMRYYNF